jgi:hypothetical protein
MKTRTLPPLHPATVAMIRGHFKVGAAPVPSGDTEAAARYAVNIEPALVDLIEESMVEGAEYADLRAEASARIHRILAVAKRNNDTAIAKHMEHALSYLITGDGRRRWAVALAVRIGQANHGEAIPRSEFLETLESIVGEALPVRTIDDDLKSLGLAGFVTKRRRGKPRRE